MLTGCVCLCVCVCSVHGPAGAVKRRWYHRVEYHSDLYVAPTQTTPAFPFLACGALLLSDLRTASEMCAALEDVFLSIVREAGGVAPQGETS